MFRRILLVFTDKELRGKLLSIFLLLIAARLLAHIPIPVLDIQNISPIIDNDQVFSLLNNISGGAYGRLSFVMLGVGPYITASIVIQLLGVIVPKIREIQTEEGQLGQEKINRWTRILAVPLGALSSWGILQFLASGSSRSKGVTIDLPEVLNRNEENWETFGYWFAVIASMTAGSIIMMWIGEIITEMKMGNGISLIILSGIVVRLPASLSKLWSDVWPNVITLFESFEFSKLGNWNVWKALLWENSQWESTRIGFWFFAILVITLFFVVFINDAVRNLIVVYSRRGHSEGKSRTMANVQANLPIKVNMAGVLPIIFAVSFILFPTIVSRFFFTANIESVRTTAQKVETYLSTDQSGNKLEGEYFGFTSSNNPEKISLAKNYDNTVGQDLFGFTISTYNQEKDFKLPENPTDEDRQKLAKSELKNVLFDGTYFRTEFPSGNLGFLPEFGLHFSGFLAYTFYYFIFIIFFTFFYTSTVAFKTDEVADNLQKSGAYIPGYRPGQQTADYLSYLANRLNVAGSIFLAIIAVVPIIFNNYITFSDTNLTGIVGGTTLLILVSVTIETLKQIEAQATAIDYERFTKY
jgi:preprotein translocase SecY subunit